MLEKRAKNLAHEHNYHDALMLYNEITTLYPNKMNAWIDKIRIMNLLNKEDEEVLFCYEEVTKIFQWNHDFWFEKGVILERLGKNEESIQAFQRARQGSRAVRDLEVNVQACIHASLIFLKLNKEKESFWCLVEAREKDPDPIKNTEIYEKHLFPLLPKYLTHLENNAPALIRVSAGHDEVAADYCLYMSSILKLMGRPKDAKKYLAEYAKLTYDPGP